MKTWWEKNKGWISFIARYAFGILIIVWLLRSDRLSFKSLGQVEFWAAAVSLFIAFIQMILASWRVQILLGSHGIRVGLWRCFAYNALGIFYSLFLPGGMSGDLARAYAFWKKYPEASKSALFGGLFIDRLLGMAAMLGMGLIAGTFLMAQLKLQKFLLVSWALFLLAGVGYWVVTALHRRGDKERRGLLGRLLRFFEKIDLRGYPLKTLVLCIGISLVGHMGAVAIVYIFSVALSSGLGLLQVAAVAPIGFLANALPLTPGGLGIGEKGFDLLYNMVGGHGGGNVFLVSRVFLFSPAFVGALVVLYKFLKSHRGLLDKKPTNR